MGEDISVLEALALLAYLAGPYLLIASGLIWFLIRRLS